MKVAVRHAGNTGARLLEMLEEGSTPFSILADERFNIPMEFPLKYRHSKSRFYPDTFNWLSAKNTTHFGLEQVRVPSMTTLMAGTSVGDNGTHGERRRW
jgi:hypothetical protein